MLKPEFVRIEASSICQLKCPSCPTASGVISSSIVGSGFLTASLFQQFLEANPFIESVELSNWGEVFLNPEILSILRCAHEHGVDVHIANGANLNNVKPDVLEAIVKYGVKRLVCSIDGATSQTYAMYRVNGNLENVLKNIDAINRYKKEFDTTLPTLIWQFVIFGHNEHEIEMARAMAQDRGMELYLKMNWDDLYDRPVSPARDQVIRNIFGVANRAEFLETFNRPYIWKTCEALWDGPQINFNGDVLGCCINHWESFGNVFEEDYLSIVNGEKMSYARSMLAGEVPERADIACSRCKVYLQMRSKDNWIGKDKAERDRASSVTTQEQQQQ